VGSGLSWIYPQASAQMRWRGCRSGAGSTKLTLVTPFSRPQTWRTVEVGRHSLVCLFQLLPSFSSPWLCSSSFSIQFNLSDEKHAHSSDLVCQPLLFFFSLRCSVLQFSLQDLWSLSLFLSSFFSVFLLCLPFLVSSWQLVSSFLSN